MKKIIILLLSIFFISCSQNSNSSIDIESNLKKQLNNYMVAYNGGDPDEAIKYCYPDMFVFLKKEFPAEFNIEQVKDVFKSTIKKMSDESKLNKFKYEFKVGEITKRINLGQDKIYKIVAYVIVKKDNKEIKNGDEVVAVTNDGGKNWTFIQMSESTPLVLKIKFPNDVVQQLSEKN